MIAAIFAVASVVGSFTTVASPQSAASWRGTVIVDGMIHEPSGYHPYKSTINLRLRESERVAVPGGFRVPLVSDGSVYEVVTSVHQTNGPMLCSGTGTETLAGHTIGYVETKAGKSTYHLALPRAFGAFACGRNHTTGANRFVIIGMGDPEGRRHRDGRSARSSAPRRRIAHEGLVSVQEDARRRALRVRRQLVGDPRTFAALKSQLVPGRAERINVSPRPS